MPTEAETDIITYLINTNDGSTDLAGLEEDGLADPDALASLRESGTIQVIGEGDEQIVILVTED